MTRAREAASSVRLCTLLIPVATSSADLTMRASVPAGNGVALCDAATLTPQTRPSTRIGTATVARIPSRRSSAMNGHRKGDIGRPAPYVATGVAQPSQRRVDRLLLSDGDGRACRVPGREQRDRLAGLEPQQSRRIRPHKLGELLVDRREELLSGDRTGGERRHPPQGRLFGNDRLNIGVNGRGAGSRDRGRHAGRVTRMTEPRVRDSLVFSAVAVASA
jgi:hypothetical protein